jgi:transcriptional regulator with XRE-family HTH domain
MTDIIYRQDATESQPSTPWRDPSFLRMGAPVASPRREVSTRVMPPPTGKPGVDEGVVLSLVGGNLKRLRKQHRLSLEDLAGRSGVSRAMLGQIEQGKSIPSIKTLWQVAQALSVSVSWFLEASHEAPVLLMQPPVDSPFTLPTGEAELRSLQHLGDVAGEAFHELRLAPASSLRLPISQVPRRINVTVATGVLDVMLGEVRHLVRPREALQYEAAHELVWRNHGQVQVQAFVLIRTLPVG